MCVFVCVLVCLCLYLCFPLQVQKTLKHLNKVYMPHLLWLLSLSLSFSLSVCLLALLPHTVCHSICDHVVARWWCSYVQQAHDWVATESLYTHTNIYTLYISLFIFTMKLLGKSFRIKMFDNSCAHTENFCAAPTRIPNESKLNEFVLVQLCSKREKFAAN